MGFIPMYLSSMHRAIREADPGEPFQFSPTARAIVPAESSQAPDRSPSGNGLNVSNRTDKFEIH
jgi:hypothetical protein